MRKYSMRWSNLGVTMVCAIGMSACADLTSISRKSNLPSSTDVEGRAIHLDAKQRVVLSKVGLRSGDPDMVCAEPSPDALSAFASSISGGISVTGQGAGSAATALSEAAASIGLRTQSITLMRDALYRVCEAYYNGQLSRPQVMTLMARSQDLTAAVVSVEQLTGAIVARQAALGGASGAASSASMLSNAEALTKVRELKAKYEAEVTTLTAEQVTDVAARDRKRTDVSAKQNQINAATDQATKDRLMGEKAALEGELDELETAVTDVETRLKLKQDQLNDMNKTLAALEAQLDSSVTSASANASSNATLSGGSTVSRLDKETAEAIANAVVEITSTVINKNYVTSECMAILTTPGLDLGDAHAAIQVACLDAITARANADAVIARAEQLKAQNQIDAEEGAPLQLQPTR